MIKIKDKELCYRRSEVELDEKWRYWCKKIPAIQFDSDWKVKIIPPFGGALARFVVEKDGKRVSVYFDAYANLGAVYDDKNNPIPYYEIYPSPDGDTRRYVLDEVDKMMNDIREVLKG